MYFSDEIYTEAILSNSTRKLLRFEITKNAGCSLRENFCVSFIIIFGTLGGAEAFSFHAVIISSVRKITLFAFFLLHTVSTAHVIFLNFSHGKTEKF